MPDHQDSNIRPDHSDPDASKFAEVAAGIYRRFDPGTVLAALRFAVRRDLFSENPTIMLMFVRIAEIYPAAVDLLRLQLADANDAERKAIQLVLEPPAGTRDAEYLPESIQSPGEMDLCWAEFLVTGKTDVVERILEVLDREDRTRVFLAQQLSNDFSLSDAERMDLQEVGIGIGKLTDDAGWQVMTPGDTDLFLWLGIKDQKETCQRVFQQMDAPLQLHLACKGAALWSLQANAQQHGAVRLLCDRAMQEPGGFGRKLLIPS